MTTANSDPAQRGARAWPRLTWALRAALPFISRGEFAGETPNPARIASEEDRPRSPPASVTSRGPRFSYGTPIELGPELHRTASRLAGYFACALMHDKAGASPDVPRR